MDAATETLHGRSPDQRVAKDGAHLGLHRTTVASRPNPQPGSQLLIKITDRQRRLLLTLILVTSNASNASNSVATASGQGPPSPPLIQRTLHGPEWSADAVGWPVGAGDLGRSSARLRFVPGATMLTAARPGLVGAAPHHRSSPTEGPTTATVQSAQRSRQGSARPSALRRGASNRNADRSLNPSLRIGQSALLGHRSAPAHGGAWPHERLDRRLLQRV